MHMQEPSGHSSKRVVAKTKENTSIPLYLDTQKAINNTHILIQLVEATSNLQEPKVGVDEGVQLGSQHIHRPVLLVLPQSVDPPRRSSVGAISSPLRKAQKLEQGSCRLHQMAHQQGCLPQQ